MPTRFAMKAGSPCCRLPRPAVTVFVWLLLVLLLSSSIARCAETPALTITPSERWATVFAGKETVWHFTLATEKTVEVRAAWRLTLDGRVAARGETPLRLSSDKQGIFEVHYTLPDVKPGVVMPALLTVTATSEQLDPPVVSVDKRLWIFPSNPFTDHLDWLTAQKIRLFDPDGKTAACLKDAQLPFTPVGNIDALAEPGHELLIIGEGVSFDDYHALPEMIVRAAAAGHPVLCLAPAAGTLPLPGTAGTDFPAPARLNLRRNAVITELDKHLDADDWPAGNPILTSVNIQAQHDQVTGEIAKGAAGWPWLEYSYPQNKGSLLICGFGIITQWDAGPTPRFLLARLLEYVGAEVMTDKP